MSARPSAFVAKLRRELLQRPGFSAKPRCPACGEEREPKDFARSGICQPCESERAAVSEAWEAERWAEANGGPVAQHPPMFDCPEAARPFLIEDQEAV